MVAVIIATISAVTLAPAAGWAQTEGAASAQSAPAAPAAPGAPTAAQASSKAQGKAQRKPQAKVKPKTSTQSPATSASRREAGSARPRPAALQGVPYAPREDAMRFADEIAQRQGLDPAWTRRMVGQAQQVALVQRLMQPPPAGARKNWVAYRGRFIDAIRVNAGLRFWQTHQATLARAEREFGVPAEIIVGIIGVETLYGQHMGEFRVLDALATLSFDHPPQHPRAAERSAYFRGELEQLLTLAHRSGGDPRVPLGSFAGAMGLPQFMPSSAVRWAVDFDGDGRIDLRTSVADAIGSVGSYFKAFGWRPGMPSIYPVRLNEQGLDLEGLLAPDILPSFSASEMTRRGAILEGAAASHEGLLALVELQNGETPSTYVAGTDNFYVITRYNQSSYYAMAVLELGQAVKDALARAR
jgi:membrane-bound lytic murein transglycosylase B